jgi:hypothetical protein
MTTPPAESQSADRPSWIGWCLIVVTCSLTLFFGIRWGSWIADALQWDAGPRAFMVIPVVLAGFGFWIGVYTVCEKLGIPLTRRDDGIVIEIEGHDNEDS